jgi:8-oxo-dGTP pyrophosphatase MutT (NUDIX family)
VLWPNGLDFVFSAHLTQVAPPESLVTSVRAIAHCAGLILAFDDRLGSHVIPGGRREEGESFIDTLRRELREETGCMLESATLQLGVLQMHLRSPKPENHRYPYPDALHLIYLAAVSRPQNLQSSDDWVLRPRFISADEAVALAIGRTERVFLDAALAQLHRSR